MLGWIGTALIGMYFYRWKKRENFPHELEKEIKEMRKEMVTIRGQVKYLEGRLNGKHWIRET